MPRQTIDPKGNKPRRYLGWLKRTTIVPRRMRLVGRQSLLAFFACAIGVMMLQPDLEASARRVSAQQQPLDAAVVHRGIGTHELQDVYADGRNSAQSVGIRSTGDFVQESIVRHWDGSSWTGANAPQPYNSELFGVDGSGPDDAWAVGDQNYQLLTQHWDGLKWTAANLPPPDGYAGGILLGVDARQTDDTWAVGFAVDAEGHPARGICEHWNGKHWRQVDVPASAGYYLNGVLALDKADVWISIDVDGELLHWDGTEWRIVSVPGQYTPLAVDGVSSRDVWAVGVGPDLKTGILHWDGRSWSPVSSPSGDGPYNFLLSVSADSSDSAWAVGYSGGPDQGRDAKTLTLHWDGVKWRKVPSPSPGSAVNILRGVSSRTPTDAWAVGSYGNSSNSSIRRLLYMHWDGARWTLEH